MWCVVQYRYLGNLYSFKVYTCYIKCNTFLVGMVGCFIHAHHDHQTQRNEDTAYDLWGGGEGRGGECEGEEGGLDGVFVQLTPNNPLKSPSAPIMDSWLFWYLAKSSTHP